MNILLSGASGFLGKIMQHSLKQQGHNITGIGRSIGPLNIDIAKAFRFDKTLKADIVIHAAGKAHSIPQNKEEEEVFYQVNFEGTKNLCNAIDQMATLPTAFIFISTVAVYGVDSGEMISEEYPLNGGTPYARSKILAEQFLHAWAKNKNIVLGIIRLPLVAGPDAPGNLGAMIKGIKSGKYLSIGKANSHKSIVWASDIALIISAIAQKGGVYNLTDGQHPSFKELEICISKALRKKTPASVPMFIAKLLGIGGDVLGNKFPINSDKLRKITSTLTFNDQKAITLLDWKPSPVLDKLSEIL